LYKAFKFAMGITLLAIIVYYLLLKEKSIVPIDCNLKKEAKHMMKMADDNYVDIHAMHDARKLKYYFEGIYKVRVPNTPAHQEVQDFIFTSMRYKVGWFVEADTFQRNTVIGPMTFTNIIAIHNPKAAHRLVLACHYYSKMEPRGFLGATDSAVPCAMLIDLAEKITSFLDRHQKEDFTIEIIFFDGEEAFVQWNHDDSIYGSRHLAQRYFTEHHYRHKTCTKMTTIDMFVLLDLIGYHSPMFRDYHDPSSEFYKELSVIESTANRLGLVENKGHTYFPLGRIYASIGDDHTPFMEKGVRVLHLIPYPFPDVWHTMKDDEKSIDWSTVQDISFFLRVFVMQYMHLPLPSDVPVIGG
jgi:glutaminyl-peptide cyclotransferase